MANPIEPPPFRTELKHREPNRFADVRGGGSGPSGTVGFAPPEPESYLRYDLGDGQGMREFRHGQEPTHGTFSMMTAPENVNAVTGASQMEDLYRDFQLAQGRRANLMMQPYERGQALPPPTVGSLVDRRDSMQSAQDILRRMDERFGQIDAERERFMAERSAAGVPDAQARLDADDYAMRLERRAMMAEQLAQGRALPGAAFDNRYR